MGAAVGLTALPQARHGGQQLPRRQGDVVHRRGIEAVVTAAAGCRERLAKIGQLQHTAAIGALGVMHHGLQLGPRGGLHGLQGLAGFGIDAAANQLVGGAQVARTEVQHALARLTVAPGAAGFLVIGLQRAWQVEVHDPAHIGLVDAHAEGHGGHHDRGGIADEFALVVVALRGVESGVVRQGFDAIGQQARGDVVDALARQAVDDAAAALAGTRQEPVVAAAVLGLDRPVQVGPVKTGDMPRRRAQLQLVGDIVAHGGRGGGGEAKDGRLWQTLAHAGQSPVLGPEVVAPVRHAVGFVDHHLADGGHLAESFEKAGHQQSFWRHIEQLEAALFNGAEAGGGLGGGLRRIEQARLDAVGAQQAHLVLHQRDQR